MKIMSLFARAATLTLALGSLSYGVCYSTKDIDCVGEPKFQTKDIGYIDGTTGQFIKFCTVTFAANCLGSGKVTVLDKEVTGSGAATNNTPVNCGTIVTIGYKLPSGTPQVLQDFCIDPKKFEVTTDTKVPCSISTQIIGCVI